MATAPKTKAPAKKAATKPAKKTDAPAKRVDKRKRGTENADWEGITKAWRAGVLSAYAISDLYGVAEPTIRKKMKELGIERDLSTEVRKEVRAQIVRTEMGVDNPTEEEIITEAANAQVAIIRTHQKRLSKLTNLVETLAEELTFDSAHVEELQEDIYEDTKGEKDGQRRARMLAAVSLGSRAGVLQALSNSVTKLITLERQAHGIDENTGKDKGTPMDDLLNMVDGKTAGLPFGQR